MIRKCNTSHSKHAYTPYHAIHVTEFVENQQEGSYGSPSADDLANEQLTLNILKIKECKKQTEEFLLDMNKRIALQNQAILSLQARSQLQRKNAKDIRMKYHDAVLNLRRKEEQNERLQRLLQECKERFDFVVTESNQSTKIWVQREQKYKKQISELQQMIHQKAAVIITEKHHVERQIVQIDEKEMDSLVKADQSTFL